MQHIFEELTTSKVDMFHVLEPFPVEFTMWFIWESIYPKWPFAEVAKAGKQNRLQPRTRFVLKIKKATFSLGLDTNCPKDHLCLHYHCWPKDLSTLGNWSPPTTGDNPWFTIALRFEHELKLFIRLWSPWKKSTRFAWMREAHFDLSHFWKPKKHHGCY